MEIPYSRTQLYKVRSSWSLLIILLTNAIAACAGSGSKLVIHRLRCIGLDGGRRGGSAAQGILEGTQMGLLEFCNEGQSPSAIT